MDDFKYKFKIANKEFNGTEEVELTVHTEIKEEKYATYLWFTVTIPKYLYDKVVDTEEKYLVTRPEDFFAKEKDKWGNEKFVRFKNQLRSTDFRTIVHEFEKISCDAIQAQRVEDSVKEKVILVKYQTQEHKEVDRWHNAQKGLKIESVFQFFVAYQRAVEKYSINYLLSQPKEERDAVYVYESLEQSTSGLQGQSKGYGFKRYWNNPTLEGFKVIAWTQEREDFFNHIQGQFQLLNKKLSDFLSDMDEAKVNFILAKYKSMQFLPEYKEERQ